MSLSAAKSKLLQKSDNDVVIVSAYRTAVTKVGTTSLSLTLIAKLQLRLLTFNIKKARKGGFKDTLPEEILAAVLRAVYEKVNLDPKLIEDVAVGNVLPAGGGASAARMAALYAGIPNTAAINTVNRQCSSGLTSVNQIAMEILTGEIDIGIGELLSLSL